MRGLLDWVVVGGGVHGTHLSHVLVTARGEARDRVCVVDHEPSPLAGFWRCVEATGMTHLRSPGVHHLDLHPYSLLRFHARSKQRHGGFVPPYDRPRVALFRAHCDDVIRRHALDALRVTAWTSSIVRRSVGGFRVETSAGPLEARRVVLALGTIHELALPAWAEPYRKWHVFHAEFERARVKSGARVAVVGGGISAVQLALALRGDGAQPMIVARHGPREHQFDSDPGWLGPMRMNGFNAISPDARRAQIDRARHRGSMPPELVRAVRRKATALPWVEGEIVEARRTSDGLILALDRAPFELTVDHVILATGFARARPGGTLVERAIGELGLPCASCGFPLARETLEWAPGLFVTGGLAELQLGPVARNIAGARAAGERLVRAA